MHSFDTSILNALSSADPQDASRQKVSTRDLSSAISDLLYRKFKGLAESDPPLMTEDFILISATQLAYFMRMLLKFVDGGAYLYIKYRYTDGLFVIDIESPDGIPLELSQKAILCSAASEAGFDFGFHTDRIRLSAELLSSRVRAMAIYERASVDLGMLFESVFFES